ncbi:uncharacterized protein LOC106664893 [Cimex lectularius]|uniref:C3H1-type domain-containing protein n=1 Tax=Cimex lectularius TaxID=79782 RepID=A0A8I6TFG3_CIMLE|nr:uncharacterized protein LOC106664893 [Cimex lectularius]
MASLVADYGESSQESSHSDDSDTETENFKECADSEESTARLPPPAFSDKIKNSVFVNPFLEAEIAQYAVLEKHVKMVPQKDEKMTKKVCYMFKKGNCRFGKKCKFAHNVDNGQAAVTQEHKDNSNHNNHNQGFIDENQDLSRSKDSDDEDEPQKKKKRLGLTRGLIPSKKVMNLYKQQKEKCGK